MGKHALVVLCAAFALTALTTRGGGQDAPKPAEPPKDAPKAVDTFKAGAFLTADDVEHLDAALGYVNLTRAQLNYEKKHADHRLRLKVCDRALDDPVNLPAMAELASRDFAAQSPATSRAIAATRLLDEQMTRWQATELQADNPRETARQKQFDGLWYDSSATRAQNEANEEKRKSLAQQHEVERVGDFFGGRAVRRHAADSAGRPDESVASEETGWFLSTLGAIDRVPQRISPADRELLAATVAGALAESPLPLPGVVASEAQFFDAGASVDLSPFMVAGSRLSHVLETRAALWKQRLITERTGRLAGEEVSVPGVTGGIIRCWQGPWGKFVVGGTGPNTYEGDDFIGIIDLGGDDIYRGRVACGIGLPGRSPISFVLDLGGNDRYEGEDFTQGFGFLGVGILHDLGGGNDTYKARFCSQACGLCGYGELYDDGGDDFYQADSGVQGAGVFGYGHLIDARGNDVYRACRYAQAFAQVKGVGVLTDGAGNDLYYAGGKYLHQPLWNDRYQSLSQGFAIGNRGAGTGGGVALLLDEGDGNDVYQADIYGQGSSYWYSLGMLVDKGGNDTYTLGQYGQGAGIHLSAGILVDLAGNDTYTNPFGVGTGGAHDWAVGWLIDRAGNDLYQGNGQGQGLNYAIGILLDCAGNDSRSTNNEGSIGKGHNNDISLVLDLGGTDNYGSKEIIDGEITRRADHALVYDVPEGWFPSIDPATWPTPQSPTPDKAVVQHILIAWDGTGVDTQKQKRTKEEATALMRRVMKQSRSKGADWKQLQADYNEDCSKGTDDKGEPYDNTHNKYTVTPTARLVKPFLDLSLKLGVSQIDVCESKYGWHIIKRVE